MISNLTKVSNEPILVKTYKDGSKRYRSNACPKCGGVGYLHGYEHIDGARCWKCGASGYFPHEWTEPSQERIDRNREKQKAKLIAQADEKNEYFLKSNGFNKDGKTYLVMGNTYDIKDKIKSLGGKFDYLSGWKLPEDNIDLDTLEVSIDEVAEKDENGWYRFRPEYNDIISNKKRIYQEAQKKAAPDYQESNFVGEIGDKIDLTVTLVKEYTYETNYSFHGGTSTIYTFKDKDGNKLIWNTGTAPMVDDEPIEEGKKYRLSGTVKDQKEYRGEKETVLTRCKIGQPLTT